MSLETWKAEFYSQEAATVAEADALAHSLVKWRGLTKENLERHGVVQGKTSEFYYGLRAKNGMDFAFTGYTCALCVHFFEGNVGEHNPCSECALFHQTGISCDDDGSNYVKWKLTGDPLPMIHALEATLRKQSPNHLLLKP